LNKIFDITVLHTSLENSSLLPLSIGDSIGTDRHSRFYYPAAWNYLLLITVLRGNNCDPDGNGNAATESGPIPRWCTTIPQTNRPSRPTVLRSNARS